MKSIFRTIAACLFVFIACASFSQERFNDYFNEKAFRFDFLLTGNYLNSHIIPVQMKMEPFWAGSKLNLIDNLDYGTYRFEVFDVQSEKLIFRRGFCTLFQEWQTTADAKKAEKSYYQAIFFPYPKQKVKIKIENRNRNGKFDPLFETVVDPSDYFINQDTPEKSDIITVIKNGKPEDVIDIVFLAEGYEKSEKEKFSSDVERMCKYLFAASPFSENKNKFNVTAVWTPSDESGTDIPGEHIYRNTRFNSAFYTFNISRYLTTSDMKSIYDAAAAVPWDHLIVLVNSPRYGGGGFYNFLTVCTSDHEMTPKVLVHEFGHAFAGLADEYYNSDVAYQDYYNLSVEPWEPNITTLVDFSAKWKTMTGDSVPIPTPATAKYASVTGAFEGGGYMAKGIYRPNQDCLMKSNGPDGYCPVCKSAVQKIIQLNSR